MQHTDDIAFQRAILANPADTTLKLVYADWLQERDDPRAEIVREQARVNGMVVGRSPGLLAKWFGEQVAGFGPNWVALMKTLAQPLAPFNFQGGEPGHPFTEPVGNRDEVVTFESQYRTVNDWNEGLLIDLAFLTSIEWGECCYGPSSEPMQGFICELSVNRDLLTARDVLTAIKAADFQSEHIASLDATAIPYPGYHPLTVNDEIHHDFTQQYMFSHEAEDVENTSTRGLKNYVADGRLWYVLLHVGEKPTNVVLLAVGRSPNGKRLVGAITSQMCHDLCD